MIPPVLAADLVTEIRRGRDGLRLRIEVTVQAADLSEAVTVAWEALEEATSEVGGFDLTGTTAEAGPAPSHIAWLAVRTLPYAFAVAGLPGGERWEFGPAHAESRITGAAGAFCRVAAQRLAPGASGLTATGPDAATALRVVRTYAA